MGEAERKEGHRWVEPPGQGEKTRDDYAFVTTGTVPDATNDNGVVGSEAIITVRSWILARVIVSAVITDCSGLE
jgi:hypothetical protein